MRRENQPLQVSDQPIQVNTDGYLVGYVTTVSLIPTSRDGIEEGAWRTAFAVVRRLRHIPAS